MRLVALGLCVAAIAAPAAFAKGRILVKLGDSTPRVGHSFTVYVRTDYVVPPNDWLRLIAVAPNKNWYDVVGAVTGDSSIAQANIPHDGFEIRLVHRTEELARGCPAAASRPLAARRSERDAPWVHAPAARGVDALGPGSPLGAASPAQLPVRPRPPSPL